MNFLAGIQHSNSVVLEGARDIIVPRHVAVSRDIKIMSGTSGRPSGVGGHAYGQPTIIMLSPVLIQMKIPVCITLQGVQVRNISTKGFSTYFSVVPDGMRLSKAGVRVPAGNDVSQGTGVTRGMASTIIMGVMDGVVHCNDCKFATDLGLCSSTSGACIVENCSKSVFRHCTFDNILPDKVMSDGAGMSDIMKGPRVCIAASPSWGRSVFSACDTIQGVNVWGGCSAV